MMKNNRKSLLLSLAIIISVIGAPIYADTVAAETENVQPAKQSMVSKAKKAALKQYHESMARWNKCLHGKCDRWEAAKAARDLVIAVGGVITGMYGVGHGIQRSVNVVGNYVGWAKNKKALVKAYDVGQYLKAPGKAVTRMMKRPLHPFQEDDRVEVINGEYKWAVGTIDEIDEDGTIWVDFVNVDRLQGFGPKDLKRI